MTLAPGSEAASTRSTPCRFRVLRHQNAAWLAANVLVERGFDSAEAVLVHIHVADDLRGQESLRIDAHRFFLDIDSAKIEGFDAVGDFRSQFVRDDRERVGIGEFGFDVVG